MPYAPLAILPDLLRNGPLARKSINAWFWVYFLLLLVLFVSLRWIGFDGLYGQDAYAYAHNLSALHQFFTSGGSVPECHYPPGMALSGLLFYTLGVSPALALSMVSVLSFGGLILIFSRAIRSLYPNLFFDYRYPVFILGMSPAMIKASQVAMSDMAASAFGFTCWYSLFAYSKHGRVKYLSLAAIAFVMSVVTRQAMVVVLVPALFMALPEVWKNRHSFWAVFLVLLGLGLLWGIFLLVEIPPFAKHPFLDGWHWTNAVSRSFETIDGHLNYSFPNLFFVSGIFWHRAFLALGPVLVLLIWKKPYQALNYPFLWIPVFGYMLFLAGIPVQNERYFSAVFPLVALGLYPGFCRLKVLAGTRFSFFLVVLGIVQAFLIYRNLSRPVQISLFEQEMARDLLPWKNRPIYAFSIDIALRERMPGTVFYNLWERRYPKAEQNGMLLFNESAFAKTWAGHNPMLNFRHFQKHHQLEPILKWPDGWVLYAIH